MHAMLSTLELNATANAASLTAYAEQALEGLRQEPGFRGLLVLNDSLHPTAHIVTLWESAQHMAAARAKVASEERRAGLTQFLATPLRQRRCEVLLQHFEDVAAT